MPEITSRSRRHKWLIPVAVVAVLAVIAGVMLSISYNDMVKKRNAVDNQFTQINIALERQFQLVENVVNSVKGSQPEREVMDMVAKARTKYRGAADASEKIDAANDLLGAVSRLTVMQEQYPDLKASQPLQSLIADLEQSRLSQQRETYNDSVARYNDSIDAFPRKMAAGIFGFKKRSIFATLPGATQPN